MELICHGLMDEIARVYIIRAVCMQVHIYSGTSVQC